MKKISSRKTAVVWVNEVSQLKVLPICQIVEWCEDSVEEIFWSHPEDILFVHDDAKVERDGYKYIITCEDQELRIDVAKVFRFPGTIEEAVVASMITEDACTPRVEELGADVSILIADASTNPNDMSSFFNLEFEFSLDFDEGCAVCTMHRDQAYQIRDFLNEAVFIRKDTDLAKTNFLQKNMKRAIFISDTSNETVLKWFVDTFRITFERAKIERVVLTDLLTDKRYVADVDE